MNAISFGKTARKTKTQAKNECLPFLFTLLFVNSLSGGISVHTDLDIFQYCFIMTEAKMQTFSSIVQCNWSSALEIWTSVVIVILVFTEIDLELLQSEKIIQSYMCSPDWVYFEWMKICNKCQFRKLVQQTQCAYSGNSLSPNQRELCNTFKSRKIPGDFLKPVQSRCTWNRYKLQKMQTARKYMDLFDK